MVTGVWYGLWYGQVRPVACCILWHGHKGTAGLAPVAIWHEDGMGGVGVVTRLGGCGAVARSEHQGFLPCEGKAAVNPMICTASW